MNVTLIRMWSGEDVIADLIKENDDSVVITNPIVAVPTGTGTIQFAPWSPLLEGRNKELEVTKKYIVYISETQPEVVSQYEDMYSVIKTPSKKLVT